MLDFDYNPEKDKLLKETRGIGFDEIIEAITSGRGLLKNADHFNKKKYPNQRMFIVRVRSYIYVVPYVIDKERKVTFLKTIYPNRDLTKKYLKNE